MQWNDLLFLPIRQNTTDTHFSKADHERTEKMVWVQSIMWGVLLSCWYLKLLAQPPAPPQNEVIVLKGGTLHIGNGTVIEDGIVVFEKGKITYSGNRAEIPIPSHGKIIDTRGKHIYPGFIAANTITGLVEIDAARPTRDFSETGELNPNVRSLIAYNTDSRIIPTLRHNGILLAQVTPQGGLIPGTSSVVQLDAWNWEDAAYKADIAVHLHWPEITVRRGWWAEPELNETNKKYLETVKKIHDFFTQAYAYYQQPSAEVNLKFEAMKGLFARNKKLFVHVNGGREISEAVLLKKKYELDMVIVGGAESYLVTDMLRENGIPVILTDIHALPQRPDDDIDITFKLPALLKQAGVDFCLSLRGSWQQRNLPFVAGTAASYGLSQEEALAAITSSVARILGIAHNTGTLEVGKDANIIVSEGDVLDMRSSRLVYAFIQGRAVELQNHQTQLYQKFSRKYGHEY